jgi:hypothetical protein
MKHGVPVHKKIENKQIEGEIDFQGLKEIIEVKCYSGDSFLDEAWLQAILYNEIADSAYDIYLAIPTKGVVMKRLKIGRSDLLEKVLNLVIDAKVEEAVNGKSKQKEY